MSNSGDDIETETTEGAPTTRSVFRSHPLASASFDTLPTQVAILDRDGTIVYTNEAWRAFGEANGIQGDPHTIGDNYLAVCAASSGDSGDTAAAGLDAVLDGERDEFSVDYPCHSPNERRWFTMRAVGFVHEGERFVLVLHLNVTEQKLAEQQARDQNAKLETTNRVGELIRGLTRTLFDAESREQLEQSLCVGIVADDDLYSFAWTTERDVNDDGIRPRAFAGDDGGFLDAAGDLSHEVRAHSAIGAATSERRVHHELASPTAEDPLSQAVFEAGGTGFVVVPMAYNETTHGSLVVHTERPDPFGEAERTALGLLGETVGYAITAMENRRLLNADSVVELQLSVDSSAVVDLSARADCTIRLDGFVPLTSGSAILYLASSDCDVDRVLSEGEAHPSIDRISAVTERDGEQVFEAVVAENSAVVTFADAGANVTEAVAEDGTGRIVAEVSPETDVREFVATIRGRYGDAELLAKRTVERQVDARSDASPLAQLTDRQRSILEAAYHAGYFDWPRNSSGTDLAESFDISPPTFHQHLQVGLRKLLASVVED
ncbi:bacterio-opsin activator domain-containing protein [Halomarina salina]|uniref:Bacterio-opsin activator domain-containing protein n=1 Tax=Halomarina salina TaxID=1872699 RepID=A0ABD5RGW1_9EURY